jgi:hypothetical protein
VIRLFTGYDAREAEGWHAFIQSLIQTSTNYRIMPPLAGEQADGTNTFTYARFLVPEICNWGGPAIFVDGADMLLRNDISQLAGMFDKTKAVQVVKHDYKTKHPRKYLGTEMEADNHDYPRKNWSSVILWNCGHIEHFRARKKIRKAVENGDGKYLHQFAWLTDNLIGELPKEWGWMPQEYGDNDGAKLLHWTAGGPFFDNYRDAPMSEHWHETAKAMRGGK